ncbi:MAG: hypothetical protein LBQ70_07145, partial [Prevotellaceae bacterium]|nr:hypothetical protein [Prevotellaceae bacterium]
MAYYNNITNKHVCFRIIFACLLLMSNISFAQRNPKYENVVKKASELSKEEAFGEYSDFLSLNPRIERANPYYQLAELASSMMQDLNPLTDYNRIKKLYHTADTYYLVCEQYLNDNDLRRDQAFFPTIRVSQRRLSEQDVSLYIKTKRGIDSIFFAEITAAVESYTSMIDSYYRCMEVYRNICKNNRNINDLYINWDENRESMLSMISKFDSVSYFGNMLGDKVPNPKFVYRDINSFRTDGLSPTDFRDVAELWNYKLWAVQQQKYYDEIIRKIIEQALIVEQKLDMHIENITAGKAPIPPERYADNTLTEELKRLQEITPQYANIERKYRVIDFLNLVYDRQNTPVAANYSVAGQAAYIHSLMEAYSKISDADRELEANYPSMKKNPSESELISGLYNSSIENYKQYVVNSEIAGKDEHFAYSKAKIPKITSSGFYRPSRLGYIV